MVKCPKCKHENEDGAQICEVCGTLLVEPAISTRHYDDTDYEEGTPKWGSARFNGLMNLVVSVVKTETNFTFDFDQITQLDIGRKNAVTGEVPPIDLTEVSGLEKGVSRDHAKIVHQDGALHIVDNGSANGTFLNGHRLIAKQPRILRNGDDIRLGHLVLRVTFERVSQNPQN